MASTYDKSHQAITPGQRLWQYFAPYKKKVATGIVCIFASNLAMLAGPLVLRYAIDDLTSGVSYTKLLEYGGMIVGVALVRGMFLFFQRRVMASISRNVEYDMSNDLYAHLQKLPLDFYHEHSTGDLMARATSDLSAARLIVGTVVMYATNTFFATLLTLPFMLMISWQLTLISFFALPFVALATKTISKKTHDESLRVQEHFGIVTERVHEALAGVSVIRAYVQERSELEHFKRLNRILVDHNMKLIHMTAILYPVLRFFVGLGFLAAFWYGGYLTTQGAITIGQFFQFTLYLGQLILPMHEFGWVVNVYERGMASMKRLHEILSVKPSIADAADTERKGEIEGAIEFRDLTFAYSDDARPVLQRINLRIEPGQTVAIVGSIGSGKSTLLNLVPRLLDASNGELLIDDQPVRDVPLSKLRAAIGYVPQETFLFGATIGENIAYGRADSDMVEIKRAASEAGLESDIEDFPNGYATQVGEKGVALSGGQKQRTAIARALIRNPPILIFDDALSSVDTDTEEKILRHLRHVRGGKTNLIVSHRLSTVKDADLIVMLDNGLIVESGTHHELLTRGGAYARLYERQLLEEELGTE